MGVRLNWLAVKDVDKAALLARLDLVERGAASDEFSSALACAVLPDGWLVLVSADSGLDLDEALPLASIGRDALGCEAEEHVMFSRLRAYRDGAPTWSVTHDPDVDLNGVAVEGEPPAPFADIRAALAAQQAADRDGDVDYMFDAPILLGQRLCGYAYDQLHPVIWTILGRPGRSRTADASPRLPEAFAAELAPRLRASGWTFYAADPAFRGRAWDVTRIIDGRRQVLSFTWKEFDSALEFETSFVVIDGPNPSDNVLLAGEVRPVRDSQPSGPSLWRRLGDRLRSRGAASPPEEAGTAPDDPLNRLLARVKEDLTAIEALLASGEPNPRIRVTHGSPDVLRPVGA